MSSKYPEKKGWNLPKQKYRVSNWTDYTQSLRQRGNITVWLSEDAISHWYETETLDEVKEHFEHDSHFSFVPFLTELPVICDWESGASPGVIDNTGSTPQSSCCSIS